MFSSSEDLESVDQQTSLIPTVEEVVREEEVQGEDAGSEQQFGVFKDFDFLDVELEDAEVRTPLNAHNFKGDFSFFKNRVPTQLHMLFSLSLKYSYIFTFSPLRLHRIACVYVVLDEQC